MTPQTLPSAEPELESARQAAVPDVEQFVINLCSSTTPMALQQPQDPQLRQFKFFISRRLEDGRERFRMHMGYFDSLLQAEDMLQLVREVYPSAWASEAPGKRLRAQQAAQQATVAAAAAPAPAPAPTPAPVAAPAAPAVILSLVADEPRAVPAAAAAPAPVAAMAAPRPAPAPAVRDRQAAQPLTARSNVREVMAALDSEPAARSSAVPTVQAEPNTSLSDSQVLRVLEGAPSETGIHMVKPEETGTFAAIKAAVQAKAPVAFAIQLQWSVQPVDASKVPPLAIFSAYTLYTVEGSREGRRWYGLRLGFFTDAHSAKQVAQYVRSEFASVAVVPVSEKERDGACGSTAPAAAAPAATQAPATRATLARLPEQSAEFKLFDDAPERGAPPPVPAAAAIPVVKPAPVAKPATGAARGKRVQAGEKRNPQTLEETLEILGADALSVEGPSTRSGAGVKHLSVKTEKRDSRLGRLFGKMGDRSSLTR